MKKIVAMVAGLAASLALMVGTANAGTPPYQSESFSDNHSVVSPYGETESVTIDREGVLIYVSSEFVKNKGRCVKGSVPGLVIETQDGAFLPSGLKRLVVSEPTKFNLFAAPGTYEITTFYQCAATSQTEVLLYDIN